MRQQLCNVVALDIELLRSLHAGSSLARQPVIPSDKLCGADPQVLQHSSQKGKRVVAGSHSGASRDYPAANVVDFLTQTVGYWKKAAVRLPNAVKLVTTFPDAPVQDILPVRNVSLFHWLNRDSRQTLQHHVASDLQIAAALSRRSLCSKAPLVEVDDGIGRLCVH